LALLGVCVRPNSGVARFRICGDQLGGSHFKEFTGM